jgi:predicted Zn-dependent peptidase
MLMLFFVFRQNSKNYYYYPMPKGAKIILIKENSPFVAINVFIKNLKLLESRKGLANLSLAMLKAGTAKRSKLQIAAELERIGGELTTSVHNDFALISGFVLKENIDAYIDLLQELILDSAYPRKEFERLKAEIIVELKQQKEDPLRYAVQLNRRRNYQGDWYAYPAAGEIDSLNSIVYADLVSFNVRDIVFAEDLVVIVNGNFSKNKVKRSLQDLLNTFKKGTAVVSSSAQINEYPSGLKVEKCGYGLNTILYNLSFPNDQKGIKHKPLNELVNSYLGDGLSSPLFKTFRVVRGISYAIGSFYDFNCRAELLTVYLQTRESNYHPLLETLKELLTFKDIPAPQSFSKIKNYALTDYYQNQQTLRQRGFSAGYRQLNGLPFNYDYAEEIQRIQYKDFCRSLRSLKPVNTLIVQ